MAIDYMSGSLDHDRVRRDMNQVHQTLRSKAMPCYTIIGPKRSGSTWLAEVLSSSPDSVMLFEPLNAGHTEAAKKAGFRQGIYVDPSEDWPEGRKYWESTLRGEVINRWIARRITPQAAVAAKRLIFKEVSFTPLMPWAMRWVSGCDRPVALFRHPCGVINSLMNTNWGRSPIRLFPPPWLKGHPGLDAWLKASAGSAAVSRTIQWVIGYLSVKRDLQGDCLLVHYENVVTNSETELDRILDYWGLSGEVSLSDMVSACGQRSCTTVMGPRQGVGGWRNQLSPKIADTVMRVVRDFGIDVYRADSDLPQVGPVPNPTMA